MKTLLTFAMALTLIACGYEENPKEETLNSEETPEVSGWGKDEAETPNSEVSVDVDVTVTINEGGENEFRLIYDPSLKTWDAARMSAPAGYRLPSRAELLDAIAEYDLGTATVWTNEMYKNNDDDVWVMSLSGESFFEHCTCLTHESVYVSATYTVEVEGE